MQCHMLLALLALQFEHNLAPLAYFRFGTGCFRHRVFGGGRWFVSKHPEKMKTLTPRSHIAWLLNSAGDMHEPDLCAEACIVPWQHRVVLAAQSKRLQGLEISTNFSRDVL